MRGFRKNILLPLVIPLGATVIIVAIVFNFSRVLLVLEERNSATVATVLAIIAAAGVLAGFAYFAAHPEGLRTGTSVLASAGLVLLFAGGYGLGEYGDHEAEAHDERDEVEEAAGGVVNVSGKEFAFDPKEPSVPAGPVTINLANAGKVVHTFVLEGVPALAKVVAPKGAGGTGTVDLKPGSYVFFCDEVGHRAAGMEGKLTVTEGGGGAPAGGGGSSTEIAGTEFSFEPKEVTVASAPVKITLKNNGKVVHTIAFETVPTFTKIVAQKAGSAEGTLDAPAGTYVFFCDEVGHRAAGMEGKLTVTGGGGGGGSGGGAAKPGGGGGKADVVGTEFAFEPKEISVPSGPVKITLKNEGKVVHTIAFETVPTFTKIVAPKAGSAEGTLDVGPGTYVFFCDEVGHRAAGMEGKLTVG